MKNLIRFKKSITLAIGIACLVCIQAVSNYSTAAEPAFDQGSNTIGLGVGFGLGYGYYSGATTSPALTFSYDHGFFPEVGPGTIGIGGIIAYKSASYDYGYKGYKAKWTNTIVAVRGTYHFTGLAEKNNKFDPYAGAIIGLRFYSQSDDQFDYTHYSYNQNYTYIVSGIFAGAKYNFIPSFGAFAELGYDVSFAKIGINFNF
ncbi:MAG: hypothetical protein IPG90_08050 [Bacteroidetes bacterium]|nr:hypothetical protein [Bacteroidota bacterium]